MLIGNSWARSVVALWWLVHARDLAVHVLVVSSVYQELLYLEIYKEVIDFDILSTHFSRRSILTFVYLCRISLVQQNRTKFHLRHASQDCRFWRIVFIAILILWVVLILGLVLSLELMFVLCGWRLRRPRWTWSWSGVDRRGPRLKFNKAKKQNQNKIKEDIQKTSDGVYYGEYQVWKRGWDPRLLYRLDGQRHVEMLPRQAWSITTYCSRISSGANYISFTLTFNQSINFAFICHFLSFWIQSFKSKRSRDMIWDECLEQQSNPFHQVSVLSFFFFIKIDNVNAHPSNSRDSFQI